jgi:hypothetical protein
VPDNSCDPIRRLCCTPCGPDECGWFQADYLLWFMKSGGVPRLAVADPLGTPRTAVGLPTTPGQVTLFGNQGVNGDLRSGLRINGGIWLDECRLWALSGDFFFLERGGEGGLFLSPGAPPLSRPFFNVRTGLPDAELVAFPGVLAGAVGVDTNTQFTGAGAFLQRNLCCSSSECGCGYRIDLLTGYRYFGFDDQVGVTENLLSTGQGLIPPGTRVIVRDNFRTENTFHGGLIGLAGNVRRGNWYANFRGGVSLGNMHRELTINGNTTVIPLGQPASVRPGGLLAQRSNIGRYSSDTFTAVPELGVNLGYNLTPNLGVHVGYSFIYLPNVWRAGDQIDLGVDPIQLQGAPSPFGRPAARLASTNAWVQGVNIGMVVRY